MKEMKLKDCNNIMRIIAEASIKIHGEYTCTIGGQKIKVVKD